MSFSIDLALKGSQLLYFIPTGQETNVKMTSNWQNPSFDGAFLPTSPAIINAKGFEAQWKVLHLNRNFPQSWLGNNYFVGSNPQDANATTDYNAYASPEINADGVTKGLNDISTSAFGVNLLLPIDGYAQSTRAVKYAVLFIGLTFLVFYFLELLNNISVHPFQYLLIGLGLCIFYILLISISEHLDFDLGYFIASAMTIGLIAWYANSILKQGKLATLVGGTLVVLYGFIFVIIQLQDYALLVGGLGLFAILALVMYFSRKINWYQTD